MSENMLPTSENLPFALSPSRANDFMQCPLLYRFRTIDKFSEPVSTAQAIGSAVHSAFERMYDLPPLERTPDIAVTFAEEYWNEAVIDAHDVVFGFDEREFIHVADKISQLILQYFTMENPQNFNPLALEQFMEVSTGPAHLCGYIDRIDKAPDGRIRIVDYKTGKTPRPGYESKVMYQLKFYAAMYLLLHQKLPSRLRLIFLGDGQFIEFSPGKEEILKFISQVEKLWDEIYKLRISGDFRPKKNSLCRWCSFHNFCPEFGGTIPQYPGLSNDINRDNSDDENCDII